MTDPRHTPDTTSNDWRHSAACANHDPDLWHPDGTTGHHILQADKAKQICLEECPVLDTCRTWALSTRQDHGVYGGLDETERRSLHRHNRHDMNNDPQMARDAYQRNQAGETINAIATDLGLGWHRVVALIAEGRAAV